MYTYIYKEPFALDVLILLYVTVELDQYKIIEKYGFIAPTCWYDLFVPAQKGTGWGTGHRDLKNYKW